MDKYVPFYMQGREEISSNGVSAEVDISAIATRVIAGEKIYKVTLEVADAALRTKVISTEKRTWLKDNEDEIKEEGVDKEKAFGAYLEGQIDEFRYLLEDETCDAIAEVIEESAEGDEEDDEPEEEEEDETEDD